MDILYSSFASSASVIRLIVTASIQQYIHWLRLYRTFHFYNNRNLISVNNRRHADGSPEHNFLFLLQLLLLIPLFLLHSHSFTVEQVKAIAGGLDRAGVDFIKLSHGDGIGGSSINYGFSAADDSLSNPAGRVFWNGTQLFVLEEDDGTNKLSG